MKLKIPLRQYAGKALETFHQGWEIGKRYKTATLQLGAVLALLPALALSALKAQAQSGILSVWEGWLHSIFSGSMPAESLSTLLVGTLQACGRNTLLYGLLSLISVLAALPLLGASQAMLYNGHAREEATGFDVLRDVARAIRPLMLTALLCMLGTWLIEIIPSLVSGLFSAVAGLLSLVPVVGEILKIASILLTLVLNGAAQAAAAVLFCYVWISAGCEGVGGKGAVLRSLTLMRQQMESTLCAVIGILLLRWALTAAAGILWVIAYAVLGLPAAVLVYAGGILTAAQSVAMGLIASALYQGRSLQGYGFYSGRPDIDRMKSANL